MTTPVNFLPWRHARLRRRIYCGCLAVGAVMLIAMMAGGIRLGEGRNQSAVLRLHIDAEHQLIHALTRREEQLKLHQQDRERNQGEEAARQRTLAWQARLGELAEQLPAQAWLNELSYQNDVLSLSGALTRFSALHALDDMMQRVTGFQPAVAGKMARDKEGRWLFSYQMKGSAAYVAP